MFLFKYGIWNQTNTLHVVFSTEPSWLAAGCLWVQPGSPLLFFSTGAEPLWACKCFSFFWNLGTPAMKRLLFHRERDVTGISLFSFDFIKVPEEDKGLRSSFLLWCPLENPKQALLRLHCSWHKGSMWRTPLIPKMSVLSSGRPTKGRSESIT